MFIISGLLMKRPMTPTTLSFIHLMLTICLNYSRESELQKMWLLYVLIKNLQRRVATEKKQRISSPKMWFGRACKNCNELTCLSRTIESFYSYIAYESNINWLHCAKCQYTRISPHQWYNFLRLPFNVHLERVFCFKNKKNTQFDICEYVELPAFVICRSTHTESMP